MKKTLLTIAVALASFLGINMQAVAQTTKTFTDYLVVTVNEESTDPQAANIVVTVKEDGLMDFNLKNFCLGSKEIGYDEDDNPIVVSGSIPVGNISLESLTLTPIEGTGNYSFTADQSIKITEGDLEGVDMWMGPVLGDIPIILNGSICNEKLYVTIDIDMVSVLGQVIKVKVGTPIDNAPLSTSVKTYTDYLVVSINQESTDPQSTNIEVSLNEDGKMNFNLKNFCLGSKEVGYDEDDNPIVVSGSIPVGNISLEGLTLTPIEGTKNYSFTADQSIKITEGDLEGVDMWMGPVLGDIPLKLDGVICDKKLYVTIDIDMASILGQVINVKVGTPFNNTILFPEKATFHTLTFIVDGETISTEDVAEGATVTAPEVTEREGYTFAWTDEVPETMPGEDVTINGSYTANKYKVTFKVGDDIVFQEEMEYGATITVPEIEEREGYTFYWRTEAPATVPAEDVEAYGEYVINQYWVQIIVDGEAIYEQLQDYGTPIVVPEVEEREGYTFAWDTEIPETVPAEAVLVHGNYTVNQYTITFMLDGQVYAEYTLDYGAEITAPEVTGDERYSFGGWEDVPETVPAHDVVIYGGMVDGVTKIENGKLKVENCYNLAGMRVNLKHVHGIIIVDGKKVFKKY